MKEKISIRHYFLLGIISIGLIGLGIGSTYAMFIASAEINNPITIDTSLNPESNVIRMFNVTVPGDGISTITLNVNNIENTDVNYAVWYTSNSSNIEVGTYFGNEDSSGSVGNISSNNTKKVYVQIKNIMTNSSHVTLGIASSYDNVTLSNNMTLVPNSSIPEPSGLAKKITDIYNNGNKSTVVSNSITYNYVTSNSIMNDRRGSPKIGINSGNIRYYGINPNNYIYFNCSDYNNQTASTCEIWRIIGVFDGKVKIMRGSQIGTLAWDQDKNSDTSLTTYDNNWTTATLMELLNNKYYNGNTSGTVSYYSGSTGSTVSNLNMTSIGLKNDVTRNMIDTETWHLGGWFSALIDTAKMYEYENSTNIYTGRDLTWDGKIALVYPSDYGYAVDFNNCSQTLYNYNLSYCLKNNWMYNIITNNGNNIGWVLTPISNDGVSVWHVNSQGYMRDLHSSYLDSGVIPTLYLKQNIDISGGNGNSSSPYQLKIS